MAERLRFKVEGMDCASCARKIETAVMRIDGVADIAVNTMTETLTLSAAPDAAPTIERLARELGYPTTLLTPAPPTSHANDPAPPIAGHVHNGDGHDLDTSLPIGEVACGEAAGHDHGVDHEAKIDGEWWRNEKGRLVIVSGILLGAAFAAAYVVPSISTFAYLAACLAAGAPVARNALKAFNRGTFFTIEMLMTIAVIGAIFIGAVEEAAVVIFLFAIGELLEGVAAGRARAGIKALATIAPKTAQLETEAGVVERPIETIEVGAIVVVRPGDRVPADGTIISGSSSLDESALTGESLAKTKSEGDPILAGSINHEAVLRVRVEKPATNTLIARVVRLVEQATEAKAPTERFINRFSRYYMPAVCALSLAVALVPTLAFGEPMHVWIYRALTLLLIACPCALVISTPAAIASALASGARRGLLVKGGSVMERIGKVKHIAFDKTGTLTDGNAKVTDIVMLADVSEAEILRLAASVEAMSSHPLAVAIFAEATARGIRVVPSIDAEALPGKGFQGTVNGRQLIVGAAGRLSLDENSVGASALLERDGKSVSAVVLDGKPIGLIALRDEPRAEAKEALRTLKRLGLHPVMLTGDNRTTGDAIGAAIGIDAHTELLPEGKLKFVKRLASQGGVAVVGDGINDAPALAAATVGIAMGSGTDVALEAGDAALLRNRIGDVAELVRLSRRTMTVIRQNVAIALGLKAGFLVTTVIGLTGLWIAVLADTGATVIVTANALRLLASSRN